MKDTFFPKKKVLNVRGNLWILKSPVVMGIINLTPDSFYDGGRYNSGDLALKKAGELYEQGAFIVDVGALSSRPGAEIISENEEWSRLKGIVKAIKTRFPGKLLSVDTFRSEIARRCLDEGADIINDISGGQLDPGICKEVLRAQAPYIAMHMKGSPENMQEKASYEHLMKEVLNYFIEFKARAKAEGLVDLIVDPGFGFAKTLEHNYQLLEAMSDLKVLESPVLVGLSRKSMVYKSLHVSAEDALNGTTALHMAALMKGADILRVHDVKEAVESITLYNKLKG